MWKYNQHYSQSRCSPGKYYFSRNVPHPRMVRHIPGLNNALICVVRSSFPREHLSVGNTIVPEQEDDEEHMLFGNTTSNASAKCCLPHLTGFVQKELGTSQRLTQQRADVPERIQYNRTSSEKPFKSFQASAQPASRQGSHIMHLTQPHSSFVDLHDGPYSQEKLNSLDQEVKVLEKLSKIFQTDSLTEIQKWFARASRKEKALVSSLIYSDQTDKDMLNSKEAMPENMNTQGLQMPLPSLHRAAEGEMNQFRSLSKESVASRYMKQERLSSALDTEKQRSGTSRYMASREELSLRKCYGNNSLYVPLDVCVPVPQSHPNSRYGLSSKWSYIQGH